jgi:hypothetical protein
MVPRSGRRSCRRRLPVAWANAGRTPVCVSRRGRVLRRRWGAGDLSTILTPLAKRPLFWGPATKSRGVVTGDPALSQRLGGLRDGKRARCRRRKAGAIASTGEAAPTAAAAAAGGWRRRNALNAGSRRGRFVFVSEGGGRWRGGRASRQLDDSLHRRRCPRRTAPAGRPRGRASRRDSRGLHDGGWPVGRHRPRLGLESFEGSFPEVRFCEPGEAGAFIAAGPESAPKASTTETGGSRGDTVRSSSAGS